MTSVQFTKYEVARIIGARALQIAMDAPLLMKVDEAELKKLGYDSIKIAEYELNNGALPITINRPFPGKRRDKLTAVKEEKISDEELAAKEKEMEKEIAEDATTLGFTEEDETEQETTTTSE